MSNKNLNVELTSRIDKEGKIFYIGKLEAPVLIDCKDGVVFLIFTSDAGSEVMQIAPLQEKYKTQHNDQ